MATLNPANNRKQSHCELYLSVLHPAVLLSGLINGSPDRGARSFAYDTGTGSGYSSVLPGMTLEIDTAYGTEAIRLKTITGSQASGTIGIAEQGIVTANNQAVRIYHNFELWPIPPGILNGVFYRDFNIPFKQSYATQPPPVAISQGVLAGFLSAGTIAFTITLADSYAIASGATIASYLHECVHNGGGITGITITASTNASTTLTITTAGEYWLYQTVTDSNGSTQTIRSVVWVHDTNNMPYTSFQLQPFSGDWESGQWRYSLSAHDGSELTRDDFPDGALCCVWQKKYVEGVESYTNLFSTGNNILYAGYLWRDTDNDKWDDGTAQVGFEIISPLQYLDSITDYGTISLEAKSSPANWAEYASWLTVGRGIHQLLRWDTTLLNIWPVYGLAENTYGVKVLEFTEDTVLQRINGVAYSRGIHAKLVSDMRGKLHLVRDSQMLNTAARAAQDTIFTIAAADISGDINVVRNQEKTRAFADMDGFTYSHPTATPFISMIPGYIENTVSYNLPEMRGTGAATDKQQVLNPAGGQTDSNERVGRRLALENVTPREVRFPSPGNYVGAFEPTVPSLGWYVWGIADNALDRELPLFDTRLRCISVTHSPIYENEVFTGLIHTSEVVLQPEAIGPDGIPGNYPTSYPIINTSEPPVLFPYRYVFSGTTDAGVFRKNWGGVWAAKNTGLTGTDLNLRSLRIHPVTKIIWICNQTGVAWSDDLGETWNEISKATLGDPVNTAGDSPAPVTADLDQIDISFDVQDQNRVYLMRTWDSPKRTWRYMSDDSTNGWLDWDNAQVLL